MGKTMEPESRTAPRAQGEMRSGHFRIYFTGFRAKPTEGAAAPAGPSAWNAPGGEDERAYFQADISWINLAENDPPQTPVQTAMITGDVRRLRMKPSGNVESPAPFGTSERQPLSLGTYALVSEANAISIGNFGIQSEATGILSRPSVRRTAPPAGRPSIGAKANAIRAKTIFLTYHSAVALSELDQGFGRGVFPIECGSEDNGPDYTLYFGIERL